MYKRLKKELSPLFSLKLTIVCLAAFFVVLIMGTLYQSEHGLYAAQEKIFASYFFLWKDFIPLPGLQLILIVLFVNLFSSIIFKTEFKPKNIGLNLTHLSTLLLLLSVFLIAQFKEESYLSLQIGESTNISKDYRLKEKEYTLPISIQLLDFTKKDYLGTDMAKSYESLVRINEKELYRKLRISMNKPLRYGFYTFYQASYSVDEFGEYHSKLAVSKNPLQVLPYIFSILCSLGLLLHFFIKLFIYRKENS